MTINLFIKKVYKLYLEIDFKIRSIEYIATNNIFNNTNRFEKNSKLRNTKWGIHSKCNHGCVIWDTKIGNYVGIAWNVTIGPRSHIYKNFTIQDFVYEKNETKIDKKLFPYSGYLCEIGHDVWIGCNSVILPGVSIGNGAIVAAGSIVTKSIPKYAIVGGNPAVILGYRFDEETIEKLENSKWFDNDIDVNKKNRKHLEELAKFNSEEFYNSYLRKRDFMVKSELQNTSKK